MGEMFFIAKSLVITVVVIVVMQVKVGETTIEQKTLHWIESSPVVLPVQEVALGGVKVVRETWKKIFGNLNNKFWNSVDQQNAPGKRDLKFTLERSEEFLRRQADKLQEKAQEAATQARDSWSENSPQEESSLQE